MGGRNQYAYHFRRMFPSYGQVATSAAPFLIFGPMLLVVAAVIWRRPGSQLKAARILILVIGTVPVVTACFMFANAWYLRVDPSSVAELKFTRLESESASDGASRTISDPTEIAEALRLLASAQARVRERESFADGYIIRVKRKGASEFSGRYIFVFRKSTKRGAVTVAFPSVSRSVRGMLVERRCGARNW